jgi:hypothetical protein
MMDLFNRKPYRIKRNGHSVFVKWLKPLVEWPPEANDAYLPSLRRHVQASVNETVWTLVGRANPSSDPEYREYVEHVRVQLIEEYSLQEIQEQIEVGVYHGGLLVLSWESDHPEKFPYYYRGIQLKPFKRSLLGD